MDCESALLLVSAALDDEITREERAELDAHLAVCPECREMAEELCTLSAALSDPGEAPPAGLVERVNAALDAGEAPRLALVKAKKKRRRAWVSVAAMLAVAACLGSVYHFAGIGTENESAARSNGAAPVPSAAVSFASEPADESVPEAAEYSLENKTESAAADPAPENAAMESARAGEDIFSSIIEPGFVANGEFFYSDPIQPAIETDLTPLDGLEQVYELLGGAEVWPQAEFDREGVDCVLGTVEEDGADVIYSIRYTGLSENGWYYTYQLNTEKSLDVAIKFSYMNYYALRLDGSELVAAFTGERNSGEYDAFQEYING